MAELWAWSGLGLGLEMLGRNEAGEGGGRGGRTRGSIHRNGLPVFEAGLNKTGKQRNIGTR